MPRTPDSTPALDAEAYALRSQGVPLPEIARRLSIRHPFRAVTRHARLHQLPDPARRRSVREAARYASSAGLPFDAEAFAALNEQVVEQVGGALFTGRTFGVEIEFRRPSYQLDPETIAQALRDAGVNAYAESYNHQTRSHWKLIHDGSSDRELVSPPLAGRDGLREVRTAMRVLRELNCRVTSAEGLHVHVYAGDLPAVQTAAIFRFYADRQRALSMLMPRSRRARNNMYCNEITARDAERVESYARQGSVNPPQSTRYLSVNLHSFARYQTVEFRQHAGTLNGRKINDWIELLLGIFAAVESNVDLSTCPTDLWGTLEWLVARQHVKQATADRLVRRAAAFGFTRPDNPTTPPAPETTPEPTTPHTPDAQQRALAMPCPQCGADTFESCYTDAFGDRQHVAMHRERYALLTPDAALNLSVWQGCECAACTDARERAARHEVTLTTV